MKPGMMKSIGNGLKCAERLDNNIVAISLAISLQSTAVGVRSLGVKTGSRLAGRLKRPSLNE